MSTVAATASATASAHAAIAAAIAAADAAKAIPMTPKERTAYLNAESARISKELAEKYTPYSKEWWTAFDAHPTIQDWRADFHHRMNASAGW
jgi:hypothetical protein